MIRIISLLILFIYLLLEMGRTNFTEASGGEREGEGIAVVLNTGMWNLLGMDVCYLFICFLFFVFCFFVFLFLLVC